MMRRDGKELRLRQQYFLSSASLQGLLKRWVSRHGHDFTQFAAKNVMQLNDALTPALPCLS